MGPLFALLAIIFISLLVVRIGTNALVMTGMSLPASQFQASSAFFGVGFTTSEAEMVVGHAVRRKIILHLIVTSKKPGSVKLCTSFSETSKPAP